MTDDKKPTNDAAWTILNIEVIHRCGDCGEEFKISKDDPHWSTGRGPICPRRAKP